MSEFIVGKRSWTVDEILMLNEACGFRLEIIDGELLTGAFAPPGLEGVLIALFAELQDRYPAGLPGYAD